MSARPTDVQTITRMSAALKYAARALGCALADDSDRRWGWGGKSLSSVVTYDSQPHWLKVAMLPAQHAFRTPIGSPFPEDPWSGPEAAAWRIPVRVSRPNFTATHRWVHGEHAFCADLHTQVKGRPLSETALAPEDLAPSEKWWGQLTAALKTLSRVQTERVTVTADRVAWAMPRFLGTSAPTEPPSWTTAHGDIQWSNLVGPDLEILDWERWGLAPTGYDLAVLYLSSLGIRDLEAEIIDRFGDVLDSPSGRFAQLYAASEFIQGFERGNNLRIEEPVKTLVARLL